MPNIILSGRDRPGIYLTLDVVKEFDQPFKASLSTDDATLLELVKYSKIYEGAIQAAYSGTLAEGYYQSCEGVMEFMKSAFTALRKSQPFRYYVRKDDAAPASAQP
jgi:hypothetical protein